MAPWQWGVAWGEPGGSPGVRLVVLPQTPVCWHRKEPRLLPLGASWLRVHQGTPHGGAGRRDTGTGSCRSDRGGREPAAWGLTLGSGLPSPGHGGASSGLHTSAGHLRGLAQACRAAPAGLSLRPRSRTVPSLSVQCRRLRPQQVGHPSPAQQAPAMAGSSLQRPCGHGGSATQPQGRAVLKPGRSSQGLGQTCAQHCAPSSPSRLGQCRGPAWPWQAHDRLRVCLFGGTKPAPPTPLTLVCF